MSEDITYFLLVPHYPASTPLLDQATLHVSLTRAINAGTNWVNHIKHTELNDHEPFSLVNSVFAQEGPLRWMVGDHLVAAEIYQIPLVEAWVPLND
jgi:hypothetical protein